MISNKSTKLPKRKICLAGCRYDVICRVAMECGFKMVPDYDLWNIIWSDAPLNSDKVMEMRRVQNVMTASGLVACTQKMNHFPGMYEICRKDRLGRNLNRLKRLFPYDYNFFPMTWDLPADIADLMDYWRRHKNSTFIIKPDAGCQGKGIFLVRNLKTVCPYAKCVCQLYMAQPFLIDGYKYDQRIYVLLTCVDPLRIYIYNEGIARLATVKYAMPSDTNLDVIFMHLTNYSLNKFSQSYDPEGDEGSKRKLSAVYTWMTEHGYDVQQLIDSIDDIIIKTILCAAPTLRHNYRASFPKRERACACFELLGFDILVDRHLKPFLVEVNHSPSFNLDLPVDNDVKTELLKDVFSMLHLGAKMPGKPQNPPIRLQRTIPPQRPRTPVTGTISPALVEQFAHEAKNLGNFRLIFEEEHPGNYSRFLDKEYCLLEDESFVKTRPQPAFNDFIHEAWGPRQKMKTSLKLTKAGQMYVDTRPVSSGVSDPQEFMKFKFNPERSPYFNESCEPHKLKKRGRGKKVKTDGNKNIVSEGASPPETGRPRPATKEDKSQEGDFEFVQECTNDQSLVPANPYPERDIGTMQNGQHRPLNPSQRVQAALDKLRQKNLEKYRILTQMNDGILRSATASTISEQTSPYLQDALRLERNAKKKLKKRRTESQNIKQYFQPYSKIFNIDHLKLPSVLQQYAMSHTPWNAESRCVTPPTPSHFGPAKNFIEHWVGGQNVKQKKRKAKKALPGINDSNNQNGQGMQLPMLEQRKPSSNPGAPYGTLNCSNCNDPLPPNSEPPSINVMKAKLIKPKVKKLKKGTKSVGIQEDMPQSLKTPTNLE